MDLAGSERTNRTNSSGQRLREAGELVYLHVELTYLSIFVLALVLKCYIEENKAISTHNFYKFY